MIAVRLALGGNHSLKAQNVSGEAAISPATLGQRNSKPEVEPAQRSFINEVVEVVDREQLEMRHDEN